MSSNENIRAVLILDIIGRPPQHLVETLKKITEEMGKEKGVSIKAKEIKDPVAMKENKEFYTTFGEIEVEADDVLYLAALMFKYMPAHVEVISPEEIRLSNNGWSEILSELTRRLHSYDEVARILQIEKQELLRKIHELGGAENLVKAEKQKTKPKKKTSKKK